MRRKKSALPILSLLLVILVLLLLATAGPAMAGAVAEGLITSGGAIEQQATPIRTATLTPTPTSTPAPPQVASVIWQELVEVDAGFTVPLSVTVRDQNDVPISGQEVLFRIASQPGADGTLDGQNEVTRPTDADGVAGVNLFAGWDAGIVTVTATAGPVTAELTVTVETVEPLQGLCGPVFPATYIGAVRIGGELAPDGLTVRGFIGELEWGRTITKDGEYALDIPQHLPGEPPCFQGGDLTFQLDGLIADESVPWGAAVQELDLTFHGPVPTPQALPTPWWGPEPTPAPLATPVAVLTPVPYPYRMPLGIPLAGSGTMAGADNQPLRVFDLAALAGVAFLLGLGIFTIAGPKGLDER